MNWWYYQYAVKVREGDDSEQVYSGVVPAESMPHAVEELINYYGDDIVDIQMLQLISEGIVFEFQAAMDDPDFNFVINRKM